MENRIGIGVSARFGYLLPDERRPDVQLQGICRALS